MFSARDQLVHLVSSGVVNEEDEGWSVAYVLVNRLLGMHMKLHLADVLLRLARQSVAAERDPRVSAEARRSERALERTAASYPEFDAVMRSVSAAFSIMVMRRTSFAQRVFVRAVLGIASLILPSASSDGETTSRRPFRESVRNPLPGDLARFGAQAA
jgi:hypothetical protein